METGEKLWVSVCESYELVGIWLGRYGINAYLCGEF